MRLQEIENGMDVEGVADLHARMGGQDGMDEIPFQQAHFRSHFLIGSRVADRRNDEGMLAAGHGGRLLNQAMRRVHVLNARRQYLRPFLLPFRPVGI